MDFRVAVVMTMLVLMVVIVLMGMSMSAMIMIMLMLAARVIMRLGILYDELVIMIFMIVVAASRLCPRVYSFNLNCGVIYFILLPE